LQAVPKASLTVIVGRVIINIAVFWYITPCDLVDGNPFRNNVQGIKINRAGKGRYRCRKDGTGTGELSEPSNLPSLHSLL
jgi:hypothetical protein